MNKSHSFAVSDHTISDWLMWFCDQLSTLKLSNLPSLQAQVALYSRLSLYNVNSNNNDPVVDTADKERHMVAKLENAPVNTASSSDVSLSNESSRQPDVTQASTINSSVSVSTSDSVKKRRVKLKKNMIIYNLIRCLQPMKKLKLFRLVMISLS